MQQEPDVQYDVQTILDKAYNKRQKKWYYLVKWQNYPIDDSTWEPFSQVEHLDAILKIFNEQYDQSFKGKYPHGIIPFWEQVQERKTNRKNYQYKNNQNAKNKKTYNRKMKNNNPMKERPSNGRRKRAKIQQEKEEKCKIKTEVKEENEITQMRDKSNQQMEAMKQKIIKEANQSDKVKIEEQEIDNGLQLLKAQIIGMRKSPQFVQNYASRLILQPFHNSFEFLIHDYKNQQNEWISRSETLKKYPIELCLFYQKHVQFQST